MHQIASQLRAYSFQTISGDPPRKLVAEGRTSPPNDKSQIEPCSA